MKVIGIVSEYNPFHNGHAYQTEVIRRLFPDAVICALMSPNFVQRGEPAFFDKYSRAKAAVLGGVDTVFSLPFVFANLSAEGFAEAGVRLAHVLKVDTLCFGTECDSKDLLIDIAELMMSENFSCKVQKICDRLPSLSIMKATQRIVGETLGKKASDIVSQPNNILAIEYIKAIKKFDLPIDILPIKREGEGYKSLNTAHLPSAMLLRQTISQGDNVKGLVPDDCGIIYKESVDTGKYCDREIFSKILYSSLYLKSAEEIEQSFGSFELASKFKKHLLTTVTLEDAINKTVGTRFTRSRIQRAIISALFGISHNEFMHKHPSFTQVLATSEKGREHLASLRHEDFPIIVKNADIKKYCAIPDFSRQFELETAADGIWALTQKNADTPNIFIKKSPFVKGL